MIHRGHSGAVDAIDMSAVSAVSAGMQPTAVARISRIVVLAAATTVALAAFAETPASADACSALPGGPQIVIQSGDTQEPLLKALGKALRNSTRPMTILYNLTGTCTLTQNLLSGAKLKVNPSYIPSAIEAPGWDPSQPSPTCTIDTTAGIPIDVGIAATFPDSCKLGTPPAPLGYIRGPIQAYAFIVPKQSDQVSIVAEEAFFVFGFGNRDQLMPWNNDLFMFIRPPTKSTLLTLAAAINVPAGKWSGQPVNLTADLLKNVATSSNAEATIGIIGAEVYDAHRKDVTELSFQAFKQHYGYLPDSQASTFDKRNLRDGHYLPWAPTFYITAVDGAGSPTNANVKYLTDLVLGNDVPGTDVDGLGTVISAGLTPDCAMKVSRPFEGGDLSLYTPAAPCGCYFEAKVPQGAAACAACVDNTTCGGGTCRHGYCEAN